MKQSLVLFIIVLNCLLMILSCNEYNDTASARAGCDTWQNSTDPYYFFDFLEKAQVSEEESDSISRGTMVINGEKRAVFFQPPDSNITFHQVPVGPGAVLKFGIGIDEEAWSMEGDGVLFEIGVQVENGQKSLLFYKYINPKKNMNERAWLDQAISLDCLAGQKCQFVFKTEMGLDENSIGDFSAWSAPTITYFNKISVRGDSGEYTDPEVSEYRFALDPLVAYVSSKNKGVRIGKIEINHDRRMALQCLYDSDITFENVHIDDGVALQFGIGIDELNPLIGDELTHFEVGIRTYNIFYKKIFEKSLDPVHNSMHRRWVDNTVDLKPYRGRTVSIVFKTDVGFEKEKQGHRAWWGNPKLVFHQSNDNSVPRSYPKSIRVKGKDTNSWNYFNGADYSDCNVILIVIDTLRPDHLGCYGYYRNTSPVIDRLASQSVVCKNVIAQSSWTKPGTASLLTGLFPKHHEAQTITDVLSDDNVLLSEILREHGYETYGFISNGNCSREVGFGQGYDHFHYIPEQKGGNGIHAKADTMNRAIFQQLSHFDSRSKLFLYVQYMDPHDPYDPREKHYSASNTIDFSKLFIINKTFGRYPATNTSLQQMIDAYDDEILFTDKMIGRLFSELKQRNLLENSIIIITADHGEELFEHGGYKHGTSLYEEVIRIPLIIRVPGRKYVTIMKQVSQIDLVPTILDLLDIQHTPHLDGCSIFDSIPTRHWEYSFSELDRNDFQCTTIRTNSDKMILYPYTGETDSYVSRFVVPAAPLSDLYDKVSYSYYGLNTEKYEDKNSYYSRDQIQRKQILKTELTNYLTHRNNDLGSGEVARFNDDQIEDLRALGYIE